jgi:ArsR family transcriptional regulator
MQGPNHTPIFGQMSVLADDARSRLLLMLERQELTVGELRSVMQLPQSTMSRHLRTLADGGWVASRPDGTHRLYHATLDELDSAAQQLWRLTREQVEASASAQQDVLRLAGVLAERRSRSQEYFAGAAGQWDRVRDELFGQRAYLLGLLGLLDPLDVVADLGCGTGAVAELLAPLAHKVIAVDDSAAMLKAARGRLKSHGNVQVRRGELEALPLPDQSVDVATLILVLHHIADPGKVVAEVSRILRPGGRLLVVDMLPHERAEYRQEMGHVWMGFGERRVRSLISAAGLGGTRIRPLPVEPSAQGPALFAAVAERTDKMRKRNKRTRRVGKPDQGRSSKP